MSRATRGRLIRPIMIELARLDTLATSLTQPDADADSGTSPGYHSNFREVRVLPPNDQTAVGAPRGDSARREKCIRCLAQWEVNNFDFTQQWASGSSPSHRIGLVFHYRDLEKRGLLDDNGRALIHVNDRVSAVFHAKSGKLIQRFDVTEGQGLFITEVEPGSMGLSGQHRNILLATAEDRETSVRRA